MARILLCVVAVAASAALAGAQFSAPGEMSRAGQAFAGATGGIDTVNQGIDRPEPTQSLGGVPQGLANSGAGSPPKSQTLCGGQACAGKSSPYSMIGELVPHDKGKGLKLKGGGLDIDKYDKSLDKMLKTAVKGRKEIRHITARIAKTKIKDRLKAKQLKSMLRLLRRRNHRLMHRLRHPVMRWGKRGARGNRGKTGNRGPKGLPGLRGRAGLRGNRGPRGVKGPPGRPGRRGSNGRNGHPGPRGAQGNVGLRGIKGKTGPLGKRGKKGLNGKRGAVGIRGIRGPHGRRGKKGVKGPHGRRGATGRRGKRGLRGAPGKAGPRGFPGHKGRHGKRGFRGNRGLRGFRGNRGHKGVRGRPGPPGKKGKPGLRGFRGPRGPRGISGVRGGTGAKGAPGHNGHKGRNGKPGARGHNGPNGRPGARGPRGAPGRNGLRGLRGKRGRSGVKGHSGRNGLRGRRGHRGPRGSRGARGPRGLRGRIGHPGRTVITHHTRYGLPAAAGRTMRRLRMQLSLLRRRMASMRSHHQRVSGAYRRRLTRLLHWYHRRWHRVRVRYHIRRSRIQIMRRRLRIAARRRAARRHAYWRRGHWRRVHVGRECTGRERFIGKMSLHQCFRKCRRTHGCRAIDYGRRGAARRCYLQFNSCARTHTSPNYTSWRLVGFVRRYHRAGHIRYRRVSIGRECTGRERFIGKMSKTQCFHKCTHNRSCHAVDYGRRGSARRCYLQFNHCRRTHRSPNYTSYRKFRYRPGRMGYRYLRRHRTRVHRIRTPHMRYRRVARKINLSGTVVNYVNNRRVSGVVVKVKKGNRVVKTVSTNGNGHWSALLAAGTYKVHYYKSGFVGAVVPVRLVTSRPRTSVSGGLSPRLPTHGVRFVLTWGNHPRDLDSHLVLPHNRCKVYWRRRVCRNYGRASLDYDATRGHGPETVTIPIPKPGEYKYKVKQYSGDGRLSSSHAKVMVFFGNRVRVYRISRVRSGNDGKVQGRFWKVFKWKVDSHLKGKLIKY